MYVLNLRTRYRRKGKWKFSSLKISDHKISECEFALIVFMKSISLVHFLKIGKVQNSTDFFSNSNYWLNLEAD